MTTLGLTILFAALFLSQCNAFQINNFSFRRRTTLASSLSNPEISRYSRHLVLSDVGMKGQEALKKSSILVIGAGGLGSPALLYLAAAGVGHLGIVDGDTVDESNLQRQIIHSVKTVGMSKCESAEQSIRNINPFVSVRTFEEEFTSATAERIITGGFDGQTPWDVVIDGSDNFPTKYLINDVCAMHKIPWVYSAILAFEGQLSVFNLHDNAPDYRDLLPVPPPPGDVPSCAEGGVLGVLPGTMGCLQATEAMKLILGHTAGLLSGRVLRMDAMTMEFRETQLARREGREQITGLIDYKGFCGGPKTADAKESSHGRTMDEAEENHAETTKAIFCELSPQECLTKMATGWTPWVLDVRLQTENDIVQLPFTDHVKPHRTVAITDVPETGDILVYCKAGVRGKKACNLLIERGVEPSRLFNLQGGIMQWQKDIDPSMPRY